MVALLGGIIIGILLPVTWVLSSAPTTGVGGVTAVRPHRQLSPEQLQNGQLPPNHPNVGGRHRRLHRSDRHQVVI